jgi:hypothetical protein
MLPGAVEFGSGVPGSRTPHLGLEVLGEYLSKSFPRGPMEGSILTELGALRQRP